MARMRWSSTIGPSARDGPFVAVCLIVGCSPPTKVGWWAGQGDKSRGPELVGAAEWPRRATYRRGEGVAYEAAEARTLAPHRRTMGRSPRGAGGCCSSGLVEQLEHPYRHGVHVLLILLGLIGFELRTVEL